MRACVCLCVISKIVAKKCKKTQKVQTNQNTPQNKDKGGRICTTKSFDNQDNV